MAKFNYNLREPNSVNETPINLVIRYSGLRLVFPTGETIKPSKFDLEKQRAVETRKNPELKDLNARLDNMESVAKRVLTNYQLHNNDTFPAVEDLRKLLNDHLNRTPKSQRMKVGLFEYIEKFIAESETRLHNGKPVVKSTVLNYKNCLRILRDYKECRYKRKPFSFENIDSYFYDDYKNYLITVQGYATNTVGKHIRTLKIFLNDAANHDLLTGFKSNRFTVVTEKVDSIYLSEVELNRLYSLDLSKIPRLEGVRDLFIVGCWTGLRFSDFSRLQSANFTNNEEIEIIAQKTGEPVVIPIHPIVQAIRTRYEGKTANGLPKPISNVKTNEYLKEIGQLAGLDEPVSFSRTEGGKRITRKIPKYNLITTHTARRSFATNAYLAKIPTITIMKITGHATESAFMRYIKVTPREHAQVLKDLWEQQRREVPFLKVS